MNDKLSNWQRNAGVIGIVALGMKSFAVAIIRHSLNGGALDIATVEAIKAACILEIKNADAVGWKITEEAEVLRQAIEQFDKLADIAIAEGWERHKS